MYFHTVDRPSTTVHYSEVWLINRFRIVNQAAQSLVLIQETIPASCADYNLAALYFYTYIQYI